MIVGEVLFDRFPDGVEVLGGAPFNVAWHLKGFGLAPLLVSRAGDDRAGRRVHRDMVNWGMDVSGLEIDQVYPTGAVDIRRSGEDHTFDILPDQAYDHFVRKQLDEALNGPINLIYQGTLIMRTPHMSELLCGFHKQTEAPLFLDLNLRDPWWSATILPQLLKRASWIKINQAELEVVARQFDCSGEGLEESARTILRAVGAELLIVTLGESGARAYPRQGEAVSVVPPEKMIVADTVGAGDAFASVSILGLLLEWPLETVMERAQEFAGCIVRRRGATSFDREMYLQMQRNWDIHSL